MISQILASALFLVNYVEGKFSWFYLNSQTLKKEKLNANSVNLETNSIYNFLNISLKLKNWSCVKDPIETINEISIEPSLGFSNKGATRIILGATLKDRRLELNKKIFYQEPFSIFKVQETDIIKKKPEVNAIGARVGMEKEKIASKLTFGPYIKIRKEDEWNEYIDFYFSLGKGIYCRGINESYEQQFRLSEKEVRIRTFFFPFGISLYATKTEVSALKRLFSEYEIGGSLKITLFNSKDRTRELGLIVGYMKKFSKSFSNMQEASQVSQSLFPTSKISLGIELKIINLIDL